MWNQGHINDKSHVGFELTRHAINSNKLLANRSVFATASIIKEQSHSFSIEGSPVADRLIASSTQTNDHVIAFEVEPLQRSEMAVSIRSIV